ncbi:histidine kinase [Fervidicella metallireducens AeB]|uniref:histidine kinase n=1 Tax=Fervidicella metallireducens AeB TaxID=1403537 RepID=A0A017RYC5_9CLOT|nr:histidine kinase [Fervidicella metallireducens AeB]
MCIGRDITEKKRMEQLKKYAEERMRILNEAMQYEKIKTEFLANISHELRTPLNVILGALQLLDLNMKSNLIYDKENKLNRYSAIMKQNCYRLLRIVNNLIDITKIDSGFSKLNLKNGNIVGIVEDIALSVADYVENKSIQLIFDTEIEEKIMAFDADKLERIILNLISNAVKFTPAGGMINVNIYDCIDSIKISVKDNGIGIPKDKLEIIFQRFRQVDKSLTRNHEGSGIGLSLVKSFVEMHGGKIEVYSTEGEGSEFIVELPVRLVEEEEETISTNDDIFSARIQRISVEFSDIYS